jgi:hypothetical protein
MGRQGCIAEALRAVLDQEKAVRPRDRGERLQIDAAAEEVGHDDRARSLGQQTLDGARPRRERRDRGDGARGGCGRDRRDDASAPD